MTMLVNVPEPPVPAPAAAPRPARDRDGPSFGGDELAVQVAALDVDAFDTLPFGAAFLDADGVVRRINLPLAQMLERRVDRTLGRSWFREVAPNTRGPAFEGRFRDGLAKGGLNAMFEYTFDYKMTPARVRVQMAAGTGGAWIFVKRL